MSTPLSPVQRKMLLEVLQLGCDYATAAPYVGLTLPQLQAEIERDPPLAEEVRRAQAQAEVRHMLNIHKAAKDEKNWRSSAWWFQRRRVDDDELFGRDDPLQATRPALLKFAVVIASFDSRHDVLHYLLAVAAGQTDLPDLPPGLPDLFATSSEPAAAPAAEPAAEFSAEPPAAAELLGLPRLALLDDDGDALP